MELRISKQSDPLKDLKPISPSRHPRNSTGGSRRSGVPPPGSTRDVVVYAGGERRPLVYPPTSAAVDAGWEVAMSASGSLTTVAMDAGDVASTNGSANEHGRGRWDRAASTNGSAEDCGHVQRSERRWICGRARMDLRTSTDVEAGQHAEVGEGTWWRWGITNQTALRLVLPGVVRRSWSSHLGHTTQVV